VGKTKIKTIDDSVKEEKKTKKSEKPSKVESVEKTIEQVRGDAEEGSRRLARTNVSEEDGRRDTAAAGPRTEADNKQAKQNKKSHGKKYQEKTQMVDQNQTYPLEEAIELAQQTSYTKFPGSLELHINTQFKNIKGTVSLPYTVGKQLTILAFGNHTKEAGADIVGTDETIDQIAKGKINFDAVVATPEWMPKLAKIAKVLGPRGLMPSPKNETVTENLTKAVSELRGGKTEYKTEANGQVIHLLIGKVNQPKEEVKANIKVLYNNIGRSKIKKITLSPTMGPGIKVNPASI